METTPRQETKGYIFLAVAWLSYLVGWLLFDFHRVWAFHEQAEHLIASTARLGAGKGWLYDPPRLSLH